MDVGKGCSGGWSGVQWWLIAVRMEVGKVKEFSGG